MKPVDVNPSMDVDFNKENNKEDPKFKADDHVSISRYKDIKHEEVKNTVPLTYVISDLKSKEIVGTFYEWELQKTNQKLRVE